MADITRPIEPFFITQEFGVNAANYKKFGLNGHNGWDLRTKHPDTPNGKRPILASWNQFKIFEGTDPKGYGVYTEDIVRLKRDWKLTYGHCDHIKPAKELKEGDTLAISDNTGNSTAPHLHFTAKPGRWDGSTFIHENYNNGYKGAVNPQEFFDELREVKQNATVIPMDPYKEKGIKLLDEYRLVRKTGAGQEGNYESFARAIIESDKSLPKLQESLQIAVSTAEGLKTQLEIKEVAFTSVKEQLEIALKKVDELSAQPPVIVNEPTFSNPVAAFFYKLAKFAQS